MCCFYLCCVVRQRPLALLFMRRDQGGFAMDYLEWAYRLIFEPLITGPNPMDIVYMIDDYVRWIFNEEPRP